MFGFGCVCFCLIAVVQRLKAVGKTAVIRKKPASILVINGYKEVSQELLERLQKKHGVEIRMYKEEAYSEERRRFLERIKREHRGSRESTCDKFSYEEIEKFADRNGSLFPSLVILCSDVSRFKNTTPYVLYSAEMLHYREELSEALLVKSLAHFARCEIRNGK